MDFLIIIVFLSIVWYGLARLIWPDMRRIEKMYRKNEKTLGELEQRVEDSVSAFRSAQEAWKDERKDYDDFLALKGLQDEFEDFQFERCEQEMMIIQGRDDRLY